jgi:uncharacterized protein
MNPNYVQGVSYPSFILCAWFVLAVVCASSLTYVLTPVILDSVHSVLLIFNYGLIYNTPTILLCWLLQSWPKIRLAVVSLTFSITVAVIFFDGRLYDLYGFHINGFVWNLLTTPGGFDSLGADQTNPMVVFKYITYLVLALLFCLFSAHIFRKKSVRVLPIVFAFLAITLSERVMYSFANASLNGSILTQADHMIFYQPLTMNKLLAKVGYQVKKTKKAVKISGGNTGNVKYPLNTIKLNKVEKPHNIIMMVAESMRYQDVFNAKVMPNSVKFAADHAVNFSHHYSGGNGTRQGLFALFYGLYGSYWDSFLRARQAPILFDVLDQYEYSYFIHTGARFTYPEFDQTIFGSISPKFLVETGNREPWKRDRKNVDLLLEKIQHRDKSKPFMGFVFFEATHARYSFPDDGVVEKDYIQSVDYAGLSREEMSPIIEGMKARYINANHYVDSQFKRVYDYLVARDMLENTIVIVTGDHGEEFMEKARWGHNSSFVEEQVRVPMIISMPGKKPGVVTRMSSHMDVSTTLLQNLGVENPVGDYSLGTNLFNVNDSDNDKDDDMVVVASWSDLGLVTPRGKLVIPFKGTTQHQHLATTKSDIPVDLGDLTATLSQQIGSVVLNSRRFYRGAERKRTDSGAKLASRMSAQKSSSVKLEGG